MMKYLKHLLQRWSTARAYKKKMRAIRKRDPYIYK